MHTYEYFGVINYKSIGDLKEYKKSIKICLKLSEHILAYFSYKCICIYSDDFSLQMNILA